ncbi:hypothetical protein [Thiosulfativibrio zosterae]|uniref:Uncharacterized protein n=1 Tax=Thiosulfativibrio zosterae TaxID=2675053 RepID=A0A6F8PL07_9GAMM|nr:hypothetical protein [Thiosulfativibrio zosterae]BBP42758.1 hypothetical protein THMIRHAT_05040 [Thiosulfativibrio zosterae]
MKITRGHLGAQATRKPAKNFGWVLASIDDMIEETRYFCNAFSQTLRAHHNEMAANIFEQAALGFEQEAQLLERHKEGKILPDIAPWEMPHPDYEHPVNWLMDADYLINEAQAWKLVERLVQIHHCYYNHLKATHNIAETLSLVSELQSHCYHCVEQARHAQQISSSSLTPSDLDPPLDQS